MKTVKILLCGIGGYAHTYVNALLDHPCADVEIVGMIDPYPQGCSRLDELTALGVVLYPSMEAFYSEQSADLAVISTPIQFHTEQILTALQHGSHVLCEKPLCADQADIAVIEQASKEAERFVDIGYQLSHHPGILSAKQDIIDGVYGKPVMLKNITLWPRDKAYFNRGIGWAGKLYDTDGKAIFDSVANNATAHYLHNIFFVCGEEINKAMDVTSLEATLLRTNPVETFDTCVLSGKLACGADFLYVVSHAVESAAGPIYQYRFEKGSLSMGEDWHLTGTLSDGSIRDYGDVSTDDARKLWLCIDAIKQGSTNICCPVEAAAVHTRVINKLHRNFTVKNTRKDLTRTQLVNGGEFTYADRLFEALQTIYANEKADLSAFYEVEA